jgi:hypothetical protein
LRPVAVTAHEDPPAIRAVRHSLDHARMDQGRAGGAPCSGGARSSWRIGPTTPTRARRFADASVDPTEARNDILGCFGRSDRSAQGDRPTKRAAPGWRELPLLGRPPVEQAKMSARKARAERWGESLGRSSPAHLIATLPRPCEALSVTPKTPPIASTGLESSHSIPIGDGAVGPPRSGFVLCLCVRQADEARGEAALHHGLADPRSCGKRAVDDRPGAHDLGRDRAGADENLTQVRRTSRPSERGQGTVAFRRQGNGRSRMRKKRNASGNRRRSPVPWADHREPELRSGTLRPRCGRSPRSPATSRRILPQTPGPHCEEGESSRLTRDVAAESMGPRFTSQDRARLVPPSSTLIRHGTGSTSPEDRP